MTQEQWGNYASECHTYIIPVRHFKLESRFINKTRYLKDKFGDMVFDYIGDSKKDIPIWESARTAYVVNNTNITRELKHIKYKIIS